MLPNLSDSYFIAFEGISNSGYGISIDEITINGEPMENFIIMAEVEGNGSIDPSGQVIVPDGESQQFDMEADYGHHISALMVDDETIAGVDGQSQFSYTFPAVDTAHTIMAYFMPDAYMVTVEVVPTGAGTVSIAGELFYGETIELSAEPAGGDYLFSHWVANGDSISAANPFSFILQSDTLIEAHFKLATGLITNLSERVQVYPNPAHDHVYIDLPSKAFVQLFDLQGRLQFEAYLPAGNKRINLSGLDLSVYIIKLQFEEQVLTRSILRF